MHRRGFQTEGAGGRVKTSDAKPDLYDRPRGDKGPSTQRAGALAPPPLDRIRKARDPFASNDGLLLAAFDDDTQYSTLKEAGPIKTGYRLAQTPFLTLLKDVAKRDDICTFHVTRT